jgi:NADPH-dependent 2,4-dienoyl-CoA reductase/sulfur reductase-like enzyme
LSRVRRRVRILSGANRIAALGDGQIQAVGFLAGGREIRLPVDHLLLHQGVVPNVNLAMSIGVEHGWDALQLCWRPIADEFGTTSIPGIAVAGDGAGICGAWAAEERGRLAGLRIVDDLAGGRDAPSEQSLSQSLRRWQIGRGFLDRLYQPAAQFRVPEDDAVMVCRCEEVTAGQVRHAVGIGCEGPNQLKSFLRCGMGPCQGRQCGLTITELIASERRVAPQAVGYYRLRPPVKPVTLAELASLPQTDAAAAAVVRQ